MITLRLLNSCFQVAQVGAIKAAGIGHNGNRRDGERRPLRFVRNQPYDRRKRGLNLGQGWRSAFSILEQRDNRITVSAKLVN